MWAQIMYFQYLDSLTNSNVSKSIAEFVLRDFSNGDWM